MTMITYNDTTFRRRGSAYAAVCVTWDTVTATLGHQHEGNPADDKVLTDALIKAGAPAWVNDAGGWIDESGWGLIGPKIEDDA